MSGTEFEAGRLLEYVLFFAFAGVTLLTTRMYWRGSAGGIMPVSLAVLGVGLVFAAMWTPRTPTVPEQQTPEKTVEQGFVSSETCRACHPGQYESWYASYHRTMTQVASPESIMAPHENASMIGGSRRFDVRFDDEGAMIIDDVDPWPAFVKFRKNNGILPKDFPRKQGEVVMTTGSHHMQLYWVPLEDDGLTQMSWTWLIRDQRWVPGETVYLQPPSGGSGIAGTWTLNCIKCHSTGGQPRSELGSEPHPAADPWVGELGIACESCHGPGDEHVAANGNPARRYALHLSGEPDDTIINPMNLDSKLAAEACAACHAGRVDTSWDNNTGGKFRPGQRIEDSMKLRKFEAVPDHLKPDYFWGDGTSRVTGREFTGMSASACYTRGEITCTSCHSMHDSDPNDQLARDRVGDEACLQCHPQYVGRISEHTNHVEDSPGSRCYNCHMPNTTYGILQLTRSHRIDIPTAAGTATTGRPNACNLCHLDQTLEWADARIARWYDKPKAEFDEDGRTVPTGALWLLKGDAVDRATASWHLGWDPAIAASKANIQPPLLARGLADPYAAVRYLAERSLRKFSGYEDIEYDFVRPARVQAGAVQTVLAIGQAPENAPLDPLEEALIERLLRERDNSVRVIRE